MSMHRMTGPPDSIFHSATAMKMKALAVILLFVAAGCASKPARPPVSMPSTAPPPTIIAKPPVPAQSVSGADLAVAAASRAENEGRYEEAAAEYERATRLTLGSPHPADLRWSLARLWADPANPGRDLGKARLACLAVAESGPSSDRAREARTMLALVDELGAALTWATGLKVDVDALRLMEAGLREELKKKDQELENIKKVLLEKKP